MGNILVCPKCNKKRYYYRESFGSWKCYNCRYEKEHENDKHTGKAINIRNWFNDLSLKEQEEIYKNFHNNDKIDKPQSIE
jgi:hypothetical protein